MDLHLRYGPQIVFDRISAHILTGDRIALAGRNGAGKTTLLKAILGEAELDGGHVLPAKGVRLGYLPQDGISGDGGPLLQEVEASDQHISSLLQKRDDAYRKLEIAKLEDAHGEQVKFEQLLVRINDIEDQLKLCEAGKLRARTERILTGLGFDPKDFEKDTRKFSGGWQMRIALAKLLLQEPDYLLLDEPTNHLDLPSQRWLENYLKDYKGGLILISHDRAFLDMLVTKTFALTQGRLMVHHGNFSDFERAMVVRKEQLLSQKEAQDRQIAQTERFIERFRAKATKASQVQSRIKQLNKIERITLETGEQEVYFEFPAAPRSNQVLVELKRVSKAYGDLKLFDGFDLKIERGQRLAVVGANGSGKSTLAGILAGELELDSGERNVGEKTHISYFAQHQTSTLNPNMSVLDCALQTGVGNVQVARNLLGSFLFSGDAVYKPVKVLSGGEKNRLALARMLLKPANLIILDEPTNHLDIQSKGILRQALKEYDGTCFIISHDRDFLDPVVEQTLEINPMGHRMFWCNVSDYLVKIEEEEQQQLIKGSGGSPGNDGKSQSRLDRKRKVELQNRMAPLKKQVEQWEARASELEEEIAQWEQRMRSPDFFSNRPDQAADMKAYEACKVALEQTLQSWELTQTEWDTLAKQLESGNNG